MINKESLISSIPSTSLVDAINKDNFDISEYVLFKILYLYANDIFERINLTKYFMDNSEYVKNKKIAETLYNNLTLGYNDFTKQDDDCLYDLIIKELGCNAEHYLDKTYQDSITKLNQIIFCNYIDDGYDLSKLDISIMKRKIGVSFKDNDASDEVETMYFNEQCEPDNLFFYNDSNWCEECDDFTDKYWWTDTKLPVFFKDCDLVKIDYKKGCSLDNLGVVFHDQLSYVEPVAYVVFMEDILNGNITLNENNIDEYLNNHKHIPFVELTVVNPKYLDVENKKHYDSFVDFYQNYQRKTK